MSLCFATRRMGWGRGNYVCTRKKNHLGDHWSRSKWDGKIIKRWTS